MQPSLYSKLAHDKDFKEESEELKDIQIMKADLILGLLRTSIIDRFCYLIQTKKMTSLTSIVAMLKILIRISRHSLSVATDLLNHETLIPLIVSNFLPLKSVHHIEENMIYQNPIHYALKFLRLLMSWGRNITKEILKKYDLGPKILCYLSIEPEKSQKMIQEFLRLIVESGRLWIVCLKYGLGIQLFMEYYPILMKHLVYFNTHLSMTDDLKASKFNYHFAVVILEIINAAIDCAPNSEEKFLLEDRKAVNLLEWSALMAIFETCEVSLKKWTVEISRLKTIAPFSMDLYNSVVSMFANFVKRASKSGAFDQTQFLKVSLLF